MTVQAVMGLRARGGSREALLRAAFDLVDTAPDLTVEARSLIWECAEPELELCAAVGLVTDSGTLDALRDAARTVQDRIDRDLPADLAPLRMELLWGHDPAGVATPPTSIPPPPKTPSATPEELLELAKNPPQRPPMPPGRIVMHPDVRARNSACGPLVEVAPDARDPEDTRFAAELLYELPPPYIERPQPFVPEFETTRRRIPGGVGHSVTARDATDLLAAVAEAYCWAQRCAEPIGPKSILPIDIVEVTVAIPSGSTPDERALEWLRAVQGAIVRERLWVRRAVVLQDSPAGIRGVLFGRVHHTAPDLGDPRDVTTSVDPDSGRHGAEVGVITAPAKP